ncbi:hypothetical protein KQX54_000412 [Cotesia glomerata]|uniref:Uncharacterized protein n=1 Tax=Cotesia glomerata TaxID=32391 RepID=A0AAV7J288_COTGL|nr:hypothetical protein KQX54_000412 [Cotesia glomerata]
MPSQASTKNSALYTANDPLTRAKNHAATCCLDTFFFGRQHVGLWSRVEKQDFPCAAQYRSGVTAVCDINVVSGDMNAQTKPLIQTSLLFPVDHAFLWSNLQETSNVYPL